MKPIVYFFGTLPNGFSSYPQDHTKLFFEDFLKRAKNTTQIVLHRKDNLLYYGYVRKINDRDCLGICLCLDRIYCDISNLFAIFDDIVANAIQAGDILTIQSNRRIKWAINRFTDETVSLIEYTAEINSKLDIEHKTIELPSVDFSISINDCLEISLEESDKIIDASKRYSNLYIVKKNIEIARVTSFYKIISNKEQQINNLKFVNTKLQDENAKIQREKKNLKKVTILSIILILGMIIGVVVYSSMSSNITELRSQLKEANNLNERNAKTIVDLNSNITELQVDIQKLKSNLKQKQSAIQTLENSISSCRDSLRTSENDNSQLREDLASCRSALRNAESRSSSIKNSTAPINITKIEIGNTYENGNIETDFGSTLYSSRTMYLTPKITYKGINADRTINLKVKWYNSDGSLSMGDSSPSGFSQEASLYVYNGSNNTKQLSGWGNKNKGFWGKGKYRIEIWYEDVCLKSKKFTIH